MTKHFYKPLYAIGKTIPLRLFACIFLAVAVLPVAAANFGRPLAAEGPTEVKVAVFVLDIDEVSNVGQSFDANVYIELRWHDPHLAHNHPNVITHGLNEVWNPRIQFINQQKIWQTLPEIVEVFPNGEVVYQQRVWGAFSQPLKLEEFPFDQQVFTIQLAAASYSPKEVKLVTEQSSRTGVANEFSLADWDILGWKVSIAPFAPSLEEESFAGYSLSIEATRRYGYYIIKVIIPLILIVIMSWVVFWIDPKESGTQISVAITTMLTLIAYRFAVGSDLPKVSYLSRLDYFILGATFLVFASLIQVVVTSTYAKGGKLDRARSIDQWARVLFPVIFILMAFGALIFRIGL
jgi:hypothetical protein